MSYFSHRAAAEAIDAPEYIAHCIDRSWLPENFKLPTWFDDYAEQVLDDKMSDECVEVIRNLKGLQTLYGIHYSEDVNDYKVFDGHAWYSSEVGETYMYNVLLAANYLKGKYPDKAVLSLHQTAFYIMPPINELNETAFAKLRRLYSALDYTQYTASGTIQDAVYEALSNYDFRQADLADAPTCRILYSKDNQNPYELLNVSGSNTDKIELPVFVGKDATDCMCVLVPTSQAVVNNLRGYAKPKVDPLPERVECCNVAATHFAEDFIRYVYPNAVYAGLASISSYLNNRTDDVADADNILDTFHKFVRVKER